MPWSREQRSRLIAAVKNHEILWRTSQNNRNHQQLMREALEIVHQQFEGDGFTFDEVKQQWRNLKDIFYKRYEVSLKRAQSGEQPNKVKPCWAHFDELKFLLTNQQWVDPEFKGRHRRKNILGNNNDNMIGQDNNNLNKNQQQDRFKYFGVFVESAVRDLHQESPELARRLMQSIYSSVSAHQIEATNKKSS
uniref:MADF domain-containing protein n=1 Tax=Meloidogyne javanica TaxID=6303 RepID=A0A915MSN7_MELJA